MSVKIIHRKSLKFLQFCRNLMIYEQLLCKFSRISANKIVLDMLWINKTEVINGQNQCTNKKRLNFEFTSFLLAFHFLYSVVESMEMGYTLGYYE